MERFYFHTDRARRLRPGQLIGLSHGAEMLAQFDAEPARFLAELFPGGVSEHGLNYLVRDRDSAPHKDSSGQMEALAEWIRRDRYPHLPSRFQSLFAWRNLEDARNFAATYILRQPTGANIQSAFWEVEAEGAAFESDMRRLWLGKRWLEGFIHLDAYWRQDYTDNPQIEVLLSMPVKIVREVRVD